MSPIDPTAMSTGDGDNAAETRRSDRRLLSRSRVVLLLLAVATIVLGLASRKYPLFPAFLDNYPGDALYAVLMYWLVALARPGLKSGVIYATAVALCFAVELLQLWQPSALEAIRATTVGHLVLGSSFAAYDLLAYACGAAVAFLLDGGFARTRCLGWLRRGA